MPFHLNPNEPHFYSRNGVYYVRFHQEGREVRKSTGLRSLTEAIAWAREHWPQAFKGKRRRDSAQGYDWRRAFQHDRQRAENRGRSDTYIETDLTARHRSLAFFQGLHRITRQQLEDYRDHNRRAGRSDEYTRRGIIVLRRACALLARDHIRVAIVPVQDNPDLRTTPRNALLRGRHLPADKLREWLDLLPKRARAVAVLELTTGLRASELRRLAPEYLVESHADPEVPAFISLPEGKGKDKSGRSMALCRAALDALHYLWSQRSMRYSPRTAWRMAARRAGLKALGRPLGYIHERDMRHNFATINGEQWADVQGLMRAMGHEDGTPDRYQTATPSRLSKFALHAARTYGLATDPSTVPSAQVSVTLDWAAAFSKMVR